MTAEVKEEEEVLRRSFRLPLRQNRISFCSRATHETIVLRACVQTKAGHSDSASEKDAIKPNGGKWKAQMDCGACREQTCWSSLQKEDSQMDVNRRGRHRGRRGGVQYIFTEQYVVRYLVPVLAS